MSDTTQTDAGALPKVTYCGGCGARMLVETADFSACTCYVPNPEGEIPLPPSWHEREEALRAKAADPDRCAAGGIIRRLLEANGKGPVELGAEIARVHGEAVAEAQALLWYIEDLQEQLREANDPAQWTARAERVSQLIAHRAVHSAEHDPAHGMIHGYCAVCGVPWPCEIAAPTLKGGDEFHPERVGRFAELYRYSPKS